MPRTYTKSLPSTPILMMIIAALAVALSACASSSSSTKSSETDGKLLPEKQGVWVVTSSEDVITTKADDGETDEKRTDFVEYEYDSKGNRIWCKSVYDSNEDEATYLAYGNDANGWRVKQYPALMADSSNVEDLTDRYIYEFDDNGNPLSILRKPSNPTYNGKPSEWTLSYNSKGLIDSITWKSSYDDRESVTVYTYNDEGLITSYDTVTTYNDGAVEEDAATYTYSATKDHRKLSFTMKNANGTEISGEYRFDENGNYISSSTVADSYTVESTYTWKLIENPSPATSFMNKLFQMTVFRDN